MPETNTINLYDTRRMLNILEQLPPEPNFLRNTFFRNTIQHDTDTVDIDVVKGGHRVTPYVRPVQEGVVMERSGFKTNSYKMPYIRVKTPSEADKYMNRSAGETPYSLETPAQRSAKALVDDFAYLAGNCEAEEERQASELIFTGRLTIRDIENRTFHNIDFGHTNIEVLAGVNKWDDASQDHNKILKFLREKRKSITTTGAPPPTHLIIASDVGDRMIELFDPTNKHSMISSIKVERGQIDIQNLPNGTTYIGYFKEIGCDIYSYDGTYLDLDGATKPYAPQGMMAMLSANARFDRNYGAIKNYHANFAAVKRFPHSWITEDGRVRMVQVETAPLYALHQIDSLAIAKVM